mmetsp:Transcript_10481/g.33191  ORF Transcript_10481/g.33191 Transcript_10481/m.33191 type:complete len:264 (-) Transcript_10481:251-1042(-)
MLTGAVWNRPLCSSSPSPVSFMSRGRWRTRVTQRRAAHLRYGTWRSPAKCRPGQLDVRSPAHRRQWHSCGLSSVASVWTKGSRDFPPGAVRRCSRIPASWRSRRQPCQLSARRSCRARQSTSGNTLRTAAARRAQRRRLWPAPLLLPRRRQRGAHWCRLPTASPSPSHSASRATSPRTRSTPTSPRPSSSTSPRSAPPASGALPCRRCGGIWRQTVRGLLQEGPWDSYFHENSAPVMGNVACDGCWNELRTWDPERELHRLPL